MKKDDRSRAEITKDFENAFSEALYKMPYREAIEKHGEYLYREGYGSWGRSLEGEKLYKTRSKKGIPITIGRVMAVLEDSIGEENECCFYKYDEQISLVYDNLDVHWKLLNDNKQDCTHHDQTEETLKTLTTIFKKQHAK